MLRSTLLENQEMGQPSEFRLEQNVIVEMENEGGLNDLDSSCIPLNLNVNKVGEVQKEEIFDLKEEERVSEGWKGELSNG